MAAVVAAGTAGSISTAGAILAYRFSKKIGFQSDPIFYYGEQRILGHFGSPFLQLCIHSLPSQTQALFLLRPIPVYILGFPVWTYSTVFSTQQPLPSRTCQQVDVTCTWQWQSLQYFPLSNLSLRVLANRYLSRPTYIPGNPYSTFHSATSSSVYLLTGSYYL